MVGYRGLGRERRGGGLKRVAIILIILAIVGALAAPLFIEPPAPTELRETEASIDFEAVLSR